MELKDLLTMEDYKIKQIIRLYYEQDTNYRLKNYFEDFLNEIEECNSCHEFYMKDDMGTSELALQDGICQCCMEDGYGK